MPATTHDDRTQSLDQQFLAQYESGKPQVPSSLPAPDEMLRATTQLTSSILAAQLPAVPDSARKLMTGQLTPGAHDLMVAVIQLLTDHPDIATEAGFGAGVFDHIKRSDTELENLGGTLHDLGTALIAAEGQQQGALFTLNGNTLVAVQTMLGEMTDPAQRGDHDALQAKFRAAFNKQDELSAQRAPTPGNQAHPGIATLQQQLTQANQDAGVRRAVAAIQATASAVQKSGALPLLPAGGATPHHHG